MGHGTLSHPALQVLKDIQNKYFKQILAMKGNKVIDKAYNKYTWLSQHVTLTKPGLGTIKR